MINQGFNHYQIHNDSRDSILERFERGEISINQAFKMLTQATYNGTPSPNYEKRHQYNKRKAEKHNKIDSEAVSYAMEELNGLIGLDHIKELVREYIAFLQVQQLREEYGLKTEPVVMHMIFKGNPGTGKTTVARIIGKIFKEIGFLETGEMIEAERADLVGEYIGHTAQKTKKMIQRALGRVLFIDEAYSLARGGEKDFGKESIDTLVKAMEDYKDNLIIILAGYREEMDFFLKTNPGLKSRFAIHLDFPDYSIDELVQIGELMFREREYILARESKHYIYRVLSRVRNAEGLNRGNARTVRNLVERSIRQHARRVIGKTRILRKDLMTIEKEDLAGGIIDE